MAEFLSHYGWQLFSGSEQSRALWVMVMASLRGHQLEQLLLQPGSLLYQVLWGSLMRTSIGPQLGVGDSADLSRSG